ncbi:MAG: hypothetical protein K8I82_25415, partial [Anaerolineae bacterium]|nr:hypothetical protein [Anaerolineae bacterium]
MLEDIRDLLRQVSAPARNNYFYGKLLGVDHFKMEQLYFNRKRWLLNRLGLGTGVLCGLETAVTEDNCLMIYPGVAIDPLGREVVVPAPYCIENLRQPTDSRGRPDGEPLEGNGSLTVCLYYYECEAEPVPVMVGECDTGPACAPNVIRERYRIQVHLDLPGMLPGSVPDEACQEIYPEDPSDDFDRRHTVMETLDIACDPPQQECVVLATVTFTGDEMTIDPYTYRPVVYSNATLFDLLMCLAEKVDACCRTLLLRYVSGDAQQEQPGNILPAPFVVEVVDGQGDAIEGEEVAFKVRGGGGFVDNDIIAS